MNGEQGRRRRVAVVREAMTEAEIEPGASWRGSGREAHRIDRLIIRMGYHARSRIVKQDTITCFS